MRLYSFVNYYLSPLQHGLQTAHIAARLLTRYKINTTQNEYAQRWARDHETIIILKGGNNADLLELAEFFKNTSHVYPTMSFCEDAQSLNGACTAVGIILTENIYETAALIRSRELFPTEQGVSIQTCRYSYNDSNDTVEQRMKKAELTRFINDSATPFERELINKLAFGGYSLA